MRKIIVLLSCLGIYFSAFSKDLQLNPAVQNMLTHPETGLVASAPGSFDYTHANRNAKLITNALKRLSKEQDLLLPEGTYYVEPILIANTVSNGIIAGAGIGKTVLVRAAFSWDNNTQGDCPLRTEVFVAQDMSGLELREMTIDGNCHQLAISGYGKWDTQTGNYSNGLPQFPTYTSNDGYAASGSSVVNIRLSKNITFDNVEFLNGYRWCLLLGKVDGFIMRNCIIDTGNISTEFKGHFDPAPNNTVMHMHTSQDGLHMVNVSNALIEYNDIHSEDSAIAIELNPSWNWGGYDIIENVVIKNNYVSTASPTDPDKLMNDDDIIYGTGLANSWIGQSAVDIFYNENFDPSGEKPYKGEDYFRNIEIKENAFENVRQGVRCGFFIGASLGHFNHRIYKLTIKDHEPAFLAGRNKDKPAGIRHVTKNTEAHSWNKSGGAGIAVRYTDQLIVSNNLIEDCSGGLGISIENVTFFEITGNRIDRIAGKQLGDLGANWTGGEGIRVHNQYILNDPNIKDKRFDAGSFLIKDNYIGQVETTKIAVITTQNGTAKLDENYNLDGSPLCTTENGVYKSNVNLIDWGCDGSGITAPEKVNFRLHPGTIVHGNLAVNIIQVEENASIRLYSIQGEILHTTDSLSRGEYLIPMEDLSMGIYLLSIQGINNQSQLIKIVKI